MKTTEQFLNNIKTSDNYQPIEARPEQDISNFLKHQLVDVNLKLMFTKLDIDPTNGYKYINGTRKTSRDTLLKILIYLEYDLEQTQSVLKQFEYSLLYAKNKRDSAIIFCLFNNYNYMQLKAYLAEHNIVGL